MLQGILLLQKTHCTFLQNKLLRLLMNVFSSVPDVTTTLALTPASFTIFFTLRVVASFMYGIRSTCDVSLFCDCVLARPGCGVLTSSRIYLLRKAVGYPEFSKSCLSFSRYFQESSFSEQLLIILRVSDLMMFIFVERAQWESKWRYHPEWVGFWKNSYLMYPVESHDNVRSRKFNEPLSSYSASNWSLGQILLMLLMNLCSSSLPADHNIQASST